MLSAPRAEHLPIGGRFVAWLLKGVIAGKPGTWTLDHSPFLIGRSPHCDLQVDDPKVSKIHAEIVILDHGCRLRDLGSHNGTRLNGSPVTEPMAIVVGDRVEFGRVALELRSDEQPELEVLGRDVDMTLSINVQATELLKPGTVADFDPGHAIQLLAEVGRILVLPRSLRESCDSILQVVGRTVPSTRAILLIKPAPDAAPQQFAALYKGRASGSMVLSQTIMDIVVNENTAVLTTDAASDFRFQDHASIMAQAIRSAMAVPLFDNESVLGLIYVDCSDTHVIYGRKHLEILTLVANMAAVKITNVRLLEAEQVRIRIAQELATAAGIQRGLLPARPPEVAGYQLHAFLQTCHEVGGDFYDFRREPDGTLCFLLGDVSGKGMGAALLMSSFIVSTRILLGVSPDLVVMTARLNALMCEMAERGHFVTAFFGRLEPATGRLTYVNAGHVSPMLISGDQLRRLDATGIPVGLLPDFQYTAAEVTLEPGDLLAVYTDGIPEACHNGEFFEDDRIAGILRTSGHRENVEALSRDIIERVDLFLDGDARSDDVTLLLLRREGQS